VGPGTESETYTIQAGLEVSCGISSVQQQSDLRVATTARARAHTQGANRAIVKTTACQASYCTEISTDDR